MQGPTAVLLATIIIGLPTVMIMLIANRFFKFREKKLEIEALNAAEKAAQYASRSHELEGAGPRPRTDRHRWRRANGGADRSAS